jgi:hypothetical protein
MCIDAPHSHTSPDSGDVCYSVTIPVTGIVAPGCTYVEQVTYWIIVSETSACSIYGFYLHP